MRVALLTYFPDTVETRSLVHAFRAFGHVIDTISPIDSTVTTDGGLQLEHAPERYDLVMTRCVQHFHNGHRVSAHLESACALALVAPGGRVVNSAIPKALAKDKVFALARLAQAGLPVPPSLIVTPNDFSAIRRFKGRSVVKLPSGFAGQGVVFSESPKSLASVVSAFQSLGLTMIVQEDIRTPRTQEYRVLILDGAVLAVHETTKDLVDPRRAELPHAILELAVRAAATLELDWSGIDLFVTDSTPTILEANSSPGFVMEPSEDPIKFAETIVSRLANLKAAGSHQSTR
jgi:glutathione synthase/RimK-type ligase-like ATP-grasp enzyme